MAKDFASNSEMERDSGMSRFFSAQNIDRYRQLASGAIGVSAREQVLRALAKEMQAFRRECHITNLEAQRRALMRHVTRESEKNGQVRERGG
jgi:hypothetical protein